MKTPTPGLRPFVNRTNDVAKITIAVSSGDELHVSPEVAVQLGAAFAAADDTTKADQAAERAEAALLSLDEARAIEATDTELVTEPAEVKTAKRSKK